MSRPTDEDIAYEQRSTELSMLERQAEALERIAASFETIATLMGNSSHFSKGPTPLYQVHNPNPVPSTTIHCTCPAPCAKHKR